MHLSNPDNLDSILGLIRKKCKHATIESFLREAKKQNNDIKISGIKDQLVFESLRTAISTGVVDIEAAKQLLFDAEESGQQHVFFYRPRAEEARRLTSDADRVREQLFGANWRVETSAFPIVLARPVEETWADFRTDSIGPFGASWTAKLYSGKYRWESLGKVPQDNETQIETWKQRLTRDVLLIRWHAGGILEFRIPQEPTRTGLLVAIDGLWQSAGRAIDERNFEKLDLTPACMKLIENHGSYANLCRLGDVRVQDQQMGSARFSPPTGRDHLMSDQTREKAIRLYRLCNELVVTWHTDRDLHGTQEPLRTTIGKIGSNSLHIRAKTTRKAIQHVTDQLRRLVSEASPIAGGPA